MNTRSRLATAISVATLTAGGAVAHSSGALRPFVDDATKVRNIPHIPTVVPHIPTVVPHIPTVVPRVPPVSGARRELDQAAEESDVSWDVVCAAIGFFDVAGDEYSTFEDFADWAWDEVDQSPRGRAERIYEAAWSLFVDGDLPSAADLACEL